MSTTTVAFLGLGRMGLPMAKNLHSAGFSVRAYDPSAACLQAAQEVGAAPAPSVEDAVEGADFVISMVPTGRHVLNIFEGPTGVFSRMKPGAMAIDSSTIAVADARRLHTGGCERNIPVLDAPVSGGVMGAQAGTLTFMVGGSAEDLERARPVFSAMGRNIFHAGDAGSGQAAKICNNLLAGISMIAVSETFALAKGLGLEPAKMREICSVSTGGCFSLTHYPPVPGLVPNVPSSREYQNGFASELMLKDLKLAEGAALETGRSLPLGGLAAALYGLFCKNGQGALDYSGIIKMIEGDGHAAAAPAEQGRA